MNIKSVKSLREKAGSLEARLPLLATVAILHFLCGCSSGGGGGNSTNSLQPYLFGSSPSILTTGELPRDAILVDLDDDQILDLVSANSGDGTLSLYKGRGDGTFGVPKVTLVGGEPRALCARDLNGDRLPDLVVALFSANAVAVLLNDANFNFTGPRLTDVGAAPSDVEVADFDLDGILDIVTADQGTGTISLARGRGNGRFSAALFFPVPGFPVSLSVGDLDFNGIPDVATASPQEGFVTVLYSDGALGFPTQLTLTDAITPTSILVAEVNGDGLPDLLVTDLATNMLLLFTNTPQGRPMLRRGFAVGQSPVAVARGQLAGDDLCDVVVANRGDNTISMLLGRTAGAFLSLTDAVSMPVGDGPSGVALGDTDGDRDADMLVVAKNAGALSVVESRADSDADRTSPLPSGEGAAGVALADLDGDGLLDGATANTVAGTVSIHRGNGDGTVTLVAEIPVGAQPRALGAADVDSDGFADLIVAIGGEDRLLVLYGDADLGLTRTLSLPSTVEPRDLVVMDLDRDLRPDVAVLNGRTPTNVRIFLNDGAGGLIERVDLMFTVGTGPQGLASGDLNRDFIPDIVVANTGDDSVSVHLATANGPYTAGPVLVGDPNSAPRAVDIGDFNGDRFADVVVSQSGSDVLSVLFGDGEGDFIRDTSNPTQIVSTVVEIFGQPRSLRVGDLNADGHLDIALCLFGRSSVAVFTGDGTGNLTLLEGADVGDGPSDIVFGDLDRNGRRDIAVAGAADGTLTLVLNRLSD